MEEDRQGTKRASQQEMGLASQQGTTTFPSETGPGEQNIAQCENSVFFKGIVGECVCIEMSLGHQIRAMLALSIENWVKQLTPGVLGVSVIIIT